MLANLAKRAAAAKFANIANEGSPVTLARYSIDPNSQLNQGWH